MKRTFDSLNKDYEPIVNANFVHIDSQDAFGNTNNLMSVLNFPEYPIDIKNKNYKKDFNSLHQDIKNYLTFSNFLDSDRNSARLNAHKYFLHFQYEKTNNIDNYRYVNYINVYVNLYPSTLHRDFFYEFSEPFLVYIKYHILRLTPLSPEMTKEIHNDLRVKKILTDIESIIMTFFNDLVEPQLDCSPILPGLSRLPKITNIPEVPLINHLESCVKIQPLTKYNNQKHTFEDNEVYSDWISRTRLFYNELNYEERRALVLYTTWEYKKINTFMRTLSYIDDKDDKDNKDDKYNKIQDLDDIKNVIRILKDVIYRAPRPRKILYAYRGTSIEWTGKKDQIPSSFKPSHFSSFSLNFNIPILYFLKNKSDILFRVEVGPSTPHVLNISSFEKLEAEIIFDPDTEFNFANMESKLHNNYRVNKYIELDEIIPVYLLTIGRKLIRSHQDYLLENQKTIGPQHLVGELSGLDIKGGKIRESFKPQKQKSKRKSIKQKSKRKSRKSPRKSRK